MRHRDTIAKCVRGKELDEDTIPWQGLQYVNQTFDDELKKIDVQEIRSLLDENTISSHIINVTEMEVSDV